MKEIKKIKVEVFRQDGTNETFETSTFFFTGEVMQDNDHGMITMHLGDDLYDFYKILNVIEKKEKDIKKNIYSCYPNYNEIFKVYDFINKNGIDNLKKEDFNITDEDFRKIKIAFGISEG